MNEEKNLYEEESTDNIQQPPVENEDTQSFLIRKLTNIIN